MPYTVVRRIINADRSKNLNRLCDLTPPAVSIFLCISFSLRPISYPPKSNVPSYEMIMGNVYNICTVYYLVHSLRGKKEREREFCCSIGSKNDEKICREKKSQMYCFYENDIFF